MFIFFARNICNYRTTQIAPFLIAIIAVVIAASLVFINIAKIGIFKTDTENAADAAALAGSTILSGGLKGIGDQSDIMFGFYVVTSRILSSCKILGAMIAWSVYFAFMAIQIANYWIAYTIGKRATDAAPDVAKQYAFNNAGVDEVKPHLKGESYQDWLRKRSRFEIWMDNEGYKSGFYSWRDRYGDNWFKVETDGPSSYNLVPLVLPIYVCYKGKVFDKKGRCRIILRCIDVCFAPGPPCSVAIGLAGIAKVSNDDEPIDIRTTRFRSDRDFGLWKAKYGEISSFSRAHPYGGSVYPFADHLYDSKITKVK